MTFNFERKVTVSDTITVASVLLSLVALVSTWRAEIDVRRRDQAVEIRKAAANSFVKLERWRQLSDEIFDLVQPTFVETSEELAREKDVVKARDFLWKGINALHLETKKSIVSEQIEGAYVPLFPYFPEARETFEIVLNELQSIEKVMLDQLLAKTEKEVLAMAKVGDYSETADLGNRLRAVTLDIRNDYAKTSRDTLINIEESLNRIITASDAVLLAKDRTILIAPKAVR